MKLLPKLAAFGCAVVTTTALAADHKDGNAVLADPAADIADVYAFQSGNNVELMMTVLPGATKTSSFSDQVLYSWHVTAYDKFLGGTAQGSTDVICSFDTAQVAQCWVGTKEYVKGNANDMNGLKSADGKLRVFAGPVADPFYFYLTGFKTAVGTVRSVVPQYITATNATIQDPTHPEFNPDGCIKWNGDIAGNRATVVGQLMTTDQTKNDFLGKNVLGITVEVDPSLLGASGQVLAVWASTNSK